MCVTIPMNKTFCFQVRHSWSYLCGHIEQDSWTELIAAAITQVVKQVSTTHKLSDNVERRLSGANTYVEQPQINHSTFPLTLTTT